MDMLLEEIRSKLVDIAAQAIVVFPQIILAVIILLLTRTVANLVRRGMHRVASRTLKSLSLQSLLVQTSFAATWTAGILFACIIAFPDLGFGDLIALLGLGSVAIGFAFQDIFKNFLSGVLLLLQEPFSIGDQIIVDSFEGTVEEIALRSTQIRTYQGELVVVPNSIVFTSPVQVMTGRPSRRTDLAIGVDYNTPLSHAVRTLTEAARSVEEVTSNPAVEVDIVGFGDSSIDMVVRYWTRSDQASVRRLKTQMMLVLKKACDQADINIPYPIRTIYHFDQEKYSDNARIEDANGRSQTPTHK
ncbi:transporter, MscS family [Synechococcus sp. PCC 7335]|uniref:mechanosensitive ion channel family protein n=1 Tax=Synechococcus sp. (strain ATCC 29403 / PCC 7335) TaxID=91464 RepID=UPI00017ED8D8|nr:mechanosensitive ion channel family protein [Synechococcus sp. PCC 7335]EDX84774.1 transporter, MscS family [Synechococcus sp. PCC 7335]